VARVRIRDGLMMALLSLGTCLAAAGAEPEVKAGGVSLTLPGPTGGFAEVGDRLKTTFFELLAPSTNRLLTAYVPTQALEQLNAGKASGGLDIYALVEVSRRTEYTDLTSQAFQKLLESMGPALGKLDTQKVGDVTEEINIRLKSLGTKPIEVGHPEMLGGIFQKADSSGFAMLMAVKQENRSQTMAMGFAALRVKQRLVFAYLYRKYESPETVNLLRKGLEEWADAILAKNN
jgi:hypothetical protein